ncbi:unnamed protein product [Phaedon cochleariae]|uniref:Myb/SANT-like DNA-binding domain-containing protein n=1 Tax=Phaedon cochleariae TaxID=80249 RepID=A0A9P0GKS1_PHACE|nr:unnamed protein product [Phaedon cochleariae]
MEEKFEFPVYLEQTGEMRVLLLTSDEKQRALDDESYLWKLIRNQTEDVNEDDNDTNDSIMIVEGEEQDGNNDGKAEKNEWSEEAVLLFLDIYRKNEANFKKSKRHNKIWQEIANEINVHNESYHYSGLQCSTKMSGLKRTFKNIKDQNKKSGNHRSTWAFYSIMDSLFGAKAFMEPQAIASSAGPSKPSSACEVSSCPDSAADACASSGGVGIKKRKVELVLESFIEHVKTESETRTRKMEEYQKKRDEERRQREKEKNELKERMHKENLHFKNALLSVLQKQIQK